MFSSFLPLSLSFFLSFFLYLFIDSFIYLFISMAEENEFFSFNFHFNFFASLNLKHKKSID